VTAKGSATATKFHTVVPLFMTVSDTWQKPVLAHASSVCEMLLAAVNSVRSTLDGSVTYSLMVFHPTCRTHINNPYNLD